MSEDIFDQDGMIVSLDEYVDAVGEYDWRDDHYECGCCSCCGCTCHDNWEREDIDELPQDLQE